MTEIVSNCILVEPIKSQTDAEMQRAYLQLINCLKHQGAKIKSHVLENEVSAATKYLIETLCKCHSLLAAITATLYK